MNASADASPHHEPQATDGAVTTTLSPKGAAVTIAADPVIIPRARQSVEEGTMSARSTAAEARPADHRPTAGAATQVTMIEPLAGFEAHTEYTLTRIDDAGMLQSLRSVRDADLRFVISPAEVFFAAYRDSLTEVITAPVAGALGIAPSEADLEMYVMLTIGTSLKDTTANLRAPLVVDHATGKAVQVILDDDTLPLSQPLPTE